MGQGQVTTEVLGELEVELEAYEFRRYAPLMRCGLMHYSGLGRVLREILLLFICKAAGIR